MEFNKEIFSYVEDVCRKAKKSEKFISVSPLPQRNQALKNISDALKNNKKRIIEANKLDVASAEENGVIKTMIDRLTLDEKRIDGICSAVEELIALDDVLGKGDIWHRPNGLEIKRTRVPLGTAAIIFEARPNVTVDAACLCIKTGNAVVLKGGKEAINTNRIFIELMKSACEKAGICSDCVNLVDSVSREATSVLLTMRQYIDVLIPRGGKGLIKAVVENAQMPCIETGAGNCHLYVDEYADLSKAINIAINAKTSRPAVCNSIETLLVHRKVAKEFLSEFAKQTEKFNLEIRGCEETKAILKNALSATEEDYFAEYDDYIIAVKVVGGVEEAVEHINKYNTKHSEAIITENVSNAEYFMNHIDAAAVYLNASTRFTDGNEFGFGAEIGISTQKLHARGPMGLEALTTVKYFITGNGQIR